MLTVISPAKKLDMSPIDQVPSSPEFQKDATSLARTSKQLTIGDLQKLMDISKDLAVLNRDRFRAFEPESTPENSKPAMFAFAGDTYTGLEAGSLDADEVAFAQDHLRILSGLYGLLRPLDAIQPYRLEMGSRLKTRRGKSLYDYWGSTISKALNDTGAEVLINCASQEYFGAVDLKSLDLDVVTPQFFEDKPGGPKIVSFFAKKARGAMARFIVQNRLTNPDQILDFDTAGYAYQPDMSEPNRPVFLRADQASQAA